MRALQFRQACTVFDEARSVPRADFNYVLEAGRLSPSSLGLEPWRFVVVEDRLLRLHLRPVCWNQMKVSTSSAVSVLLALKTGLAQEITDALTMLHNLDVSDDQIKDAMQSYHQVMHGDLVGWSVAQCHIAAADMMMAAAMIGIDSCRIGGFDPESVAKLLKIDCTRFEVAVLVALGYRAQPHAQVQPPRHRLTLDQLVEYR